MRQKLSDRNQTDLVYRMPSLEAESEAWGLMGAGFTLLS